MLRQGLVIILLSLFVASSWGQLNQCVTCQFFVGTVISSLPSNPTVTTITAKVDQLCDNLPSSLSPQCHSFIKSYGEQIIGFLSNGRSAEAVCKAVKMCQTALDGVHEQTKLNIAQQHSHGISTDKKTLVLSAEFKQQDLSCDFCTYVMWQVQSALRDNYTIGNIANTLNTVCLNLPAGKDECLKFVQSYFPLLIKYLSAHDTAIQVCKALGMCTNSTMSQIDEQKAYARAVVRHYVATHPLELSAQSSSGCQLCQWIVSAAEAWLSDGHNEAEISNFLQQVCDFFNQYAAQCQQLVAVYTPKVIEMLVENYTPPYICAQAGGCTP